MERNLVEEIWNIRGKVDESIKNKKYVRLQTYLALLRDYQKEGKHHLTETSASFGYAFWEPKDKIKNIDDNFESIIKNMETIVSKYTQNKDVSIKYGDKHDLSILEYVWICRAMYDDVLRTIGTPKEDKQRNIELLYFVEEKLLALAGSNSADRRWLNVNERSSLQEICDKVNETYNQIYNHELPLQGFAKLSQNY